MKIHHLLNLMLLYWTFSFGQVSNINPALTIEHLSSSHSTTTILQDTTTYGPKQYQYEDGYEIVYFYADNSEVHVDRSNMKGKKSKQTLETTEVLINNCLAEDAALIKHYNNRLTLKLPRKLETYQINCTNCGLYKHLGKDTLGPNAFFIKTVAFNTSPISIDFISDQGEFYQFQLGVQFPPIPDIYANNKLIRDTLTYNTFSDTLHLTTNFSQKPCLDLGHQISDWRVSNENEDTLVFGLGNALSPQEMQVLKGMKNLVLVCGVKGYDGVIRFRMFPFIFNEK